jgi:hypothetical protein
MNLAAMVVQSRAARQITRCVLDAISPSRGNCNPICSHQLRPYDSDTRAVQCDQNDAEVFGLIPRHVMHKLVAPGVFGLHSACFTAYEGHVLVEADVEVSATPTLYV